MPPDFFSQNMAVLKKIFPQLAEEIDTVKGEGLPSDRQLQIETAASGTPTLVINGLYIHSRRDPEREAERLVEAAGQSPGTAGVKTGATAVVMSNGESPALVLGFGLGYTASALAAKFPGRPIIVVEKRADILKKALETRDLRALLSRENLVFVLDGEGVTGALALFKSSPGVLPLVIWNRTLTGMYEEWYAVVEERIKTWNSRTNVNRATQKRFGKRWVRNLAQNLELVRDIPGISKLEGLLLDRDIPVFLAAAGPSLDAAGPIIHEVYKRCLVVATDTGLRFLHNRGIESDFVVSVDPQYWNFRHLDQLPSPKTRLIAESAVYPPVLRHAFGGIFLCSSFFPLGRFIEDRLEPKGDLGAGGSVATSAWDFLRFLGAKNVWIAGLDLSFPGLKTHFKGALFEERSHAESNRFTPAETWNAKALRDGQPFAAKQMGGGTVLTDKRLSLYAAWFESRFRRFPGIKNFSFSDEGLALEGIKAATREELLALPKRRDEIDKLLNETYLIIKDRFFSKETVMAREEKYEKAVKTLLTGLEVIEKTALDAVKHAGNAVSRSKLGHLGDTEREKALKQLDLANKSITESTVKEVAGFLFPDIEGWETEISEKISDPLIRHFEFSARFYKALAEAAKNNLQILSKVRKPKADTFYSGREIPH